MRTEKRDVCEEEYQEFVEKGAAGKQRCIQETGDSVFVGQALWPGLGIGRALPGEVHGNGKSGELFSVP